MCARHFVIYIEPFFFCYFDHQFTENHTFQCWDISGIWNCWIYKKKACAFNIIVYHRTYIQCHCVRLSSCEWIGKVVYVYYYIKPKSILCARRRMQPNWKMISDGGASKCSNMWKVYSHTDTHMKKKCRKFRSISFFLIIIISAQCNVLNGDIKSLLFLLPLPLLQVPEI